MRARAHIGERSRRKPRPQEQASGSLCFIANKDYPVMGHLPPSACTPVYIVRVCVCVCVYGQACAVLPPNMKQGDEGPVCEMSGKGAGRESRVKWLEVNWINTREEQCARNKIKWEIGRKRQRKIK